MNVELGNVDAHLVMSGALAILRGDTTGAAALFAGHSAYAIAVVALMEFNRLGANGYGSVEKWEVMLAQRVTELAALKADAS